MIPMGEISEFDLIKQIARGAKIYDRRVKCGIGDDAALIRRGVFYEIVTTDMLVEGDHFNLAWSTPEQVGKKALAVNVSDIAAMGGDPNYALVSLAMPAGKSADFIPKFYRGFNAAAKKYKVSLIGGDTTHGEKVTVNVVVIGEVGRKLVRLRSGAKPGDVICVTGSLGGSTAGLELLRKEGAKVLKAGKAQFKPVLRRHLEPQALVDKGRFLSAYVNAMIDVSDGLASEVRHIAEESEVGAEIYAEKVPINRSVKAVAKYLDPRGSGNDKAFEWALSGGEDFELVFTVSARKLKQLEKYGKVRKVVGRILPRGEGLWLVKNGQREKLPGGYDHFRS